MYFIIKCCLSKVTFKKETILFDKVLNRLYITYYIIILCRWVGT